MRTTAPALAFLAAIVWTAAPAAAQNKNETYRVDFTSVVDSCEGKGIELTRGKVELSRRGKVLTVKVESIPMMTGTAGKRGKFKAKAKRGRTGVAGLEGKFSIAGSTRGRTIEFVFIAEFYKGKSPLCTQSWKGKGSRAATRSRRRNLLTWFDLTRTVHRYIARL